MTHINKDSKLIKEAGKDDRWLISEFYEFKASKDLIREAEEKGQDLVMSGIMQKANTLNKNGRVYPKRILEREVEKYMELVENNRAGGELDHPDSAVVSLSNVSHRVTDLWWEGDVLWGKVLIATETEAGNTLKGLLKAGFGLGISSRGVGSVKSESGKDVVQDDFELIAFDFVSTPSTPGAWLFKESARQMKPLRLHEESAVDGYKMAKLKMIGEKDFWKNL